jgi:hypothetical protein
MCPKSVFETFGKIHFFDFFNERPKRASSVGAKWLKWVKMA